MCDYFCYNVVITSDVGVEVEEPVGEVEDDEGGGEDWLSDVIESLCKSPLLRVQPQLAEA